MLKILVNLLQLLTLYIIMNFLFFQFYLSLDFVPWLWMWYGFEHSHPRYLQQYIYWFLFLLTGKVYAVNIIGCILGTLFAGYVLLLIVGIKLAFVTLSLPFVILFLFSSKSLFTFGRKDLLCAMSGIIVIILSFFYSFSYEDIAIDSNSQVRRDYVATVVSSGQGMRKQLFTNGIA